MGLSRRSVIWGIGGTSVALVGAGGLFAATRTPLRALAPWDDITGAAVDDVRLDAFRHAILAPNPHNRQPWQIKLSGKDEALIFCDLDRRLPETDPFDRQILIGFGCFLETARLAAAQRGVRLEIEEFPEGSPAERLDRRPIAALRFVADASVGRDPLYGSIAGRRTTKQPFDPARAVGPLALERLAAHRSPLAGIATTADASMLKALRALTWDAWQVELETKRTWQETVDLMRIGRSEIEANPDGVAVGGPVLEALALAGQISRAEMARPGATAYTTAIDRYRAVMATGMAYAWITTEGNTRRHQLAAGQAYVRMNLEATRQGLGFHPVSQALQEFPEMVVNFAKVRSMLQTKSGHRVQMLMRLGYGGPVARTPRWPLQSKLTGA